MNQIMVIKPYYFEGMETWAFDDWDVELMHKPFVEGIPEMIDDFVKDIPNSREYPTFLSFAYRKTSILVRKSKYSSANAY